MIPPIVAAVDITIAVRERFDRGWDPGMDSAHTPGSEYPAELSSDVVDDLEKFTCEAGNLYAVVVSGKTSVWWTVGPEVPEVGTAEVILWRFKRPD
jgi:hypothetical protein